MDVDSFIVKYRPEWQRLGSAVARGGGGLARLPGPELRETVRLYLRASSHLAEVRGSYHDPELERYLNGLVSRAHVAVYSARPRTVEGFVALFGSRYRAAIRGTAPYIAVAAALLVGVMLAVTLWLATSPEALDRLVAPGTREAIERADGSRADLGLPAAGVTTLILFNNVQVAFLAFAFGIAFGLGTVYVVVQNAVFIGVLAGAFHAGGKAWVFWSLVLPHGFLELIAIAIAAGAGLRIGWSLVDPGDRPRVRALSEEAGAAVLVVIGVIPAFVAAAVIEGFVTGSGGVPAGIQVAFGALVAVLYVAFLFGWPATVRPDAGAGAARPGVVPVLQASAGLEVEVPVDEPAGERAG